MGCISQVVWALLGAAAFITVVTVTAFFLSKSEAPKNPYTFEDYFNNTIRWRSYNLYWITDTEYLHKARDGNVYRYNVENNTESPFLSNSTFDEVGATDYLLSGDHKYVALESNFTKQWRHSYTAAYSFYSLKSWAFVENVGLPPVVQYLSWAPEGNKMAYVADYNVYVKANITAEAVQVTSNGKKNEILNGVPDWVYEEEVFASNGALWWSTTGRYLAYAEFDDTKVKKVEFSFYGLTQYPETMAIAYPKAGSNLTKVKLFVVDTNNLSIPAKVILPPASIRSGDHILNSVTWVTDQRVAAQWVTRKQNYVLVQIYDLIEGKWKENEEKFEQMSPTGWVGHYGPLPLFFAEDKISFYKVQSDNSGYKHIHRIQKGKATPITSGKWEVIYITKLTKDAIYFVGYEDGGTPAKRHVYKVAIGVVPSPRECLTCNDDKDRCQYNLAYFSTDASYYRMDCYGPGFPRFTLMDNRGPGANALLATLEENKEIENILQQFQMPTMKYGTFNIAGFDLSYEMMLPPNFLSSRRYPLLLDVYGGPCSQRVDYRFKLNWSTFLASTYGIIVARFDGRGSGYQGDKIMHAIYRRLGTIEVEDQMEAVRNFAKMRFVDKDRIAIWGWSYGGYVTSMALGAGSGLFKCGIAVAPVASWQMYDAVYTERYMGTPQDNKMGYENSSVLARAGKFKGTQFLLIHGTADDNVHFQQAAKLNTALVDEQVDFEAMWYTDKDHSLKGAIRHVYALMSNFLKKCLVNDK
ncbi:dipeptidyl peptidase 4 [Hippocampus comes]|uniref:dipeptidyl peptidase 4 n=1 Tax=Hippocampus comes TaxID=109280 RepID=UPI00094EB787|nr:PREDICTED: dipeptidyl peptidase 4-like [Hippocampus comes]